jgi:hypothetical protein
LHPSQALDMAARLKAIYEAANAGIAPKTAGLTDFIEARRNAFVDCLPTHVSWQGSRKGELR